MSTSSRRDHLVETAMALFAARGYHATGIDLVLAESGVSKKTLYRHFPSKDDLILAVLERRAETFRPWFIGEVERRAQTPRDRLLAIFEVAGDWFEQDDFFGCMHINAIGEFSDAQSMLRDSCKAYKQDILSYLQDLCQQMEVEAPDLLSEGLALLFEGAIVTAQVSQRRRGTAEAARATAEVLLNKAQT